MSLPAPRTPLLQCDIRVPRGPSASAVPANQCVPARCLCSSLCACALFASTTGPACLERCLTCQLRLNSLASDAGLRCHVLYCASAYAPARVSTGCRRRAAAPRMAPGILEEPLPDLSPQARGPTAPARCRAPRRQRPVERAASAGSGRRALPGGERGAQAPAPAERRSRAVRRALGTQVGAPTCGDASLKQSETPAQALGPAGRRGAVHGGR